MSKDNRNTTPLKVFLLYIGASFVLICIFYIIFPGFGETGEKSAIIGRFRAVWGFTSGIIAFIHLFPVLAFSALVIPFGLNDHTEGGYAGNTFVGKKGFSTLFLQYLSWPIITAAAAAVLYSLLFFLALPLVMNAKTSIKNQSELFIQARTKAEEKYAAKEWTEAFYFINLCERIWPGNKDIEKLKADMTISQSPQFFGTAGTAQVSSGVVPIWVGLPGTPVDSAEALKLAEQAFERERYYDANWLAVLAQRLAQPGAAEIPRAIILANQAWEMICSLEPNAQEKEKHALFRMKRDGYEAMVASDWVSAYYIFLELSALTPNDPDVVQYLQKCRIGVSNIAFFIDEMNLVIGNVLTETVFSMPDIRYGEKVGRLALRFSSLAALPDYAYAWGTEVIGTDNSGNFRFRVSADYAKIIPASSRDSDGEPVEITALLLQALDRNNKNERHDPVWVYGETVSRPGSANYASQIMLNISYEDLRLLSKMKNGPRALNIWQLFTAEKKFGEYGYVPEIFKAEILRRLGEALFFLSMAVLSLVLGWRYRARVKPRYIYVPMLGILPLVFYGLVFIYRNLINNLAIQLSLNMGFSSALVFLVAGASACFMLSLILLAAQHG